jgi:hypothetical protein
MDSEKITDGIIDAIEVSLDESLCTLDLKDEDCEYHKWFIRTSPTTFTLLMESGEKYTISVTKGE